MSEKPHPLIRHKKQSKFIDRKKQDKGVCRRRLANSETHRKATLFGHFFFMPKSHLNYHYDIQIPIFCVSLVYRIPYKLSVFKTFSWHKKVMPQQSIIYFDSFLLDKSIILCYCVFYPNSTIVQKGKYMKQFNISTNIL